MHLVTFIKQLFGKVRAVLAGDTSDQGFFHDFGILIFWAVFLALNELSVCLCVIQYFFKYLNMFLARFFPSK